MKKEKKTKQQSSNRPARGPRARHGKDRARHPCEQEHASSWLKKHNRLLCRRPVQQTNQEMQGDWPLAASCSVHARNRIFACPLLGNAISALPSSRRCRRATNAGDEQAADRLLVGVAISGTSSSTRARCISLFTARWFAVTASCGPLFSLKKKKKC
jgi:hypothetical protein